MSSKKILEQEELVELRERLREAGQIVVQCHGCFDIVHPGHIRYLKFAREQGDLLIVSVSGDDVVGKRFDRPFINERLRLENLAAFEFVDYVCLDENTWAGPILEALQPDVYVKGREYETNADPRFLKERALVEDYGGKVIFSSGDVVYSSSALIERFRHRMPLQHEKIDFFCERHGLDHGVINTLLGELIGRRVLVIGDAILDHYVHCESLKVSSEEPALSVTPVGEEWYVGGAGLNALQMAMLGAEVSLITAAHPGPMIDRFTTPLLRAGVTLELVEIDRRPPFVEERYLVEETKVFKVNHGRFTPLSTVATREVAERLERHLGDKEALLVNDFGYGLFGPELSETIADLCRARGVPLFIDVNSTGHATALRLAGPWLATPTEEELRFALGDNESGLSNLASRYLRDSGAKKLVLTLGKRGAILFTPSEDESKWLRTDYLPAFAHHAIDAVGAGHAFLSAMTLCEAAGSPSTHGLYLGSLLAAAQVSRLGNEPTRLIDLEAEVAARPELDRRRRGSRGGS